MPRLTVVAPAFYPTLRPCRYLIESCRRLNIPINLHGIGEPWPGLNEGKTRRLAREFEKLDSEYFLFSDAKDSFLMAGEDEIVEKYLAIKPEGLSDYVLVSAEKNCYPQEMASHLYPKTISPWKYVNAGQYMGTKQGIIRMLESMMALEIHDDGVDQLRMSMLYVSGSCPMILDTFCSVFQSMFQGTDEDFAWDDDNRLVNIMFDSKPCAVHFNGNWPGIEYSFRERFESCAVNRVV